MRKIIKLCKRRDEKMRESKKYIALLSLLIISGVFVQSASALLPSSNYIEGQAYFYEGGFHGHVDYAVYDTDAYPEDWPEFGPDAGGLHPEMDDQYIYAYEIFTDAESYNPINYFSLLGIGEGAIDDVDSSIGTQEDLTAAGGVDALYGGFASEETVAFWEFEEGVLVGGERSWFLIMCSDHAATVGTYSFSSPVNDTVWMPNPEPCTVALLGIGAVIMFSKRKKSISKAG